MILFNRAVESTASRSLTLHRNLAIYLLDQPFSAVRRNDCFLTLDEALAGRGVPACTKPGASGELEIENLTEARPLRPGRRRRERWLAGSRAGDGLHRAAPLHSGLAGCGCGLFASSADAGTHRMGEEPTNTFKSAAHMASSRDLKLSIRREGSQKASVWSSVDAAQSKAEPRVWGEDIRCVRFTVQPAAGRWKTRPCAAETLRKLSCCRSPICSRRQPECGRLSRLPINGRLNSADLYATPELFRKLWPKLLEAAALEALTETDSRGRGHLRGSHRRGGFDLVAPVRAGAARPGTRSRRG